MPLYDYQCSKCGAVFEVRQKFSDPLLTQHENCGGELTKQLSAPAFQFKGSGWYVTDYARGGSQKAEDKAESRAEGASESESKKTESPSTSTESKPASATSSTPASTPSSKPSGPTTKSD